MDKKVEKIMLRQIIISVDCDECGQARTSIVDSANQEAYYRSMVARKHTGHEYKIETEVLEIDPEPEGTQSLIY